MKNFILGSFLILSTAIWAQEEVPGVIAIAKATELGVHRIERLVTLKKIDAAFINHLVGLRAESSLENGATFKVYGYVAADADGKSSVITLWMDSEGKTLAHNVTAAQVPANPFAWPVKDAATLAEEALHFVLEGWVQHAEVKAFYTGLKSLSVSPIQDAAGNLLAHFNLTSHDDSRTLTIVLKPDGTFVSYDVK